MTLGQTIARLRKQKGYKQSDISSKLNVTQSVVAKWESDKVRPRPQTLLELATVLEVGPEVLSGQTASGLPAAKSRPILKDLLQQLPELADDQLEALRVVVRDMMMRSRILQQL
ncbi:MAG: helix-turn-helix transcriptional regulator [Vulcanimicrobiota bacterium]